MDVQDGEGGSLAGGTHGCRVGRAGHCNQVGDMRDPRSRAGALKVALGVLAVLAGTTATASAASGPAPLALDGSAAPSPWKRYRDWNQADWSSFNDLAHPSRAPAPPEPGKLKEVVDPGKGDAAKGMQLAFSRARGGGCLSCHIMGPETLEMPGNAGPDLSEIGTWGRSDLELFNRISNARLFNPETTRPPWGAHGSCNEQEVRDMVAFLQTLKTPATFSTPLADPAKRPLPVEDRDGTDPLFNRSAELLDSGRVFFEKPGPTGKNCASCHADPDRAFKGWAARMPDGAPRHDTVVGVAAFAARPAKAPTGAEGLRQGPENTALHVFLTNLSAGEKGEIDVSSPGAQAALARDEALTERKIGQQHRACLDCHEKIGESWLRGQFLGELPGQVAPSPLGRRSGRKTSAVRKRFPWHGVPIGAEDLPPDAKHDGDLEFYLTYISQGWPIEAPNIPHGTRTRE